MTLAGGVPLPNGELWKKSLMCIYTAVVRYTFDSAGSTLDEDESGWQQNKCRFRDLRSVSQYVVMNAFGADLRFANS